MELQTYDPKALLQAIATKDVKAIRHAFEEFNLVDIAETLNEAILEEETTLITDLIFVFKTVPPSYTAEVFSYLDDDLKEKLIALLTGEQISSILENLFSDDIVDFLEEMPSNLMKKILQSATKETRSEINHLLDYKANSAGSIMTTEFVELKARDTVKGAMEKIRKQGKEAETISYLFVVDAQRILVGTLRLRDLIFAEEGATVGDIMETDFVSIYTHDDQEEVAKKFKRYDLNALPVTTQDDRLVGIITADDIIDVIDQEATEDIQIMAAVAPLGDEYMKTSVLSLAKKRVVWLFVLMFSATFTGLIIGSYENLMQHLPVLAMFIPMLMDTGGNAGGQTSTLVIRGLALGEIEITDYWQVLRKEIGVALIAGGALGLFDFVWILVQNELGLISVGSNATPPYLIAGMVAITLFVTVFLAKSVGSTLPILAKRLKLDPALMAGPLMTTIVDALSLMLYFFIATQIFHLV